jgi:hypothetical protein
LNRSLAGYGWTEDQYRMLFQPLVQEGQEALWSMGDDTPPAFLSHLPHPLWDYCKQRFAQVTNPPIDSLRESHVMSLDVYLGETATLNSPILDAGQVKSLRGLGTCHSIDLTFEASGGVDLARKAIAGLKDEARRCAAAGGVIILTDRALDEDRAALPALLAVSAAWEAIVGAGGYQIPLVVESGQIIDTHHVALLMAAGASAVYPFLAMAVAARTHSSGASRYRATVEKGLRKVLAKMGISTLASYRNSQLFEIIGLNPSVSSEFFPDANRTLGGKDLNELLADYVRFHDAGFGSASVEFRDVGLYRFRHNGEQHANSPELVRRMHRYLKSPTPENQAAFSILSDQRTDLAIRDLMEFRPGEAIAVDEVEAEVSLLSRFGTQAMSLDFARGSSHTGHRDEPPRRAE